MTTPAPSPAIAAATPGGAAKTSGDICAHCDQPTAAPTYVAHIPVCPKCMDDAMRLIDEAQAAMDDEYEDEDDEE